MAASCQSIATDAADTSIGVVAWAEIDCAGTIGEFESWGALATSVICVDLAAWNITVFLWGVVAEGGNATYTVIVFVDAANQLFHTVSIKSKVEAFFAFRTDLCWIIGIKSVRLAIKVVSNAEAFRKTVSRFTSLAKCCTIKKAQFLTVIYAYIAEPIY